MLFHLSLYFEYRAYVPEPCPAMGIYHSEITLTFAGNTRNNWASYDSLLIVEAAFALANVLTFGRLLQTVVMISGRLGVLQVSLTGMIGDIVKFLLLFSMTWISFALGMTQLYRPFDEIKFYQCQKNAHCFNASDCQVPAFIR